MELAPEQTHAVNGILQAAYREGMALEAQHTKQETGSSPALPEDLRRFWKEPAPEADEGTAKPTQIPAARVESDQKAIQGT
jgi:hypothetical protein